MGKEIIEMDHAFNEQDTAQYIKAYMFIKGFAVGRRLEQTQIALAVARHFHDGQYRKDGTPYICHPLRVCSTLISYGIDDDITLAAALLHDVIEDCQDKLPYGGKDLISEYGVDMEVINIVMKLSKESGLDDYALSVYFDAIKKDPRALLIKLSDRLHNSSTLYEFTLPKMKKYIRETSMFLLPMASYGKRYYPKYNNALSILKSSIYSLNHSMEIMLQKIEEQCECNERKKDEKRNL